MIFNNWPSKAVLSSLREKYIFDGIIKNFRELTGQEKEGLSWQEGGQSSAAAAEA